MSVVLIGIDDTDNQTSPGTGQLARRLAVELERRGARGLGITRHQFLLDDRIPYTTHNSGACVAVEWPGAPDELEFAIDLIENWAATGSDPGICIVANEDVPPAVVEWGWAATRQVLTLDGAINLAAEDELCLRALGGTGGGIIGAMASVGLRADGNEGRFLDWPGLRMLPEVAEIGDLVGLGIEVEHHMPIGAGPYKSDPVGHNRARYKTMNWVRPRLVRGKPVWPVEWSENDSAWVPVDRKKTRPLE